MSYDAAKDPFAGRAADLAAPGARAQLVTPNDGADLAPYPKGLRLYVPATLTEASLVVTPKGAASDADKVTLRYPPGVAWEPLSVRRIWATGTSAGIDIHAIQD